MDRNDFWNFVIGPSNPEAIVEEHGLTDPSPSAVEVWVQHAINEAADQCTDEEARERVMEEGDKLRPWVVEQLVSAIKARQ